MQVELVARAMDGDQDAFASLAAASIDRCYALAYRILRDPHRAQDAAQQALIGAWHDLRTLRDPERFDAWLYRLVVNGSATSLFLLAGGLGSAGDSDALSSTEIYDPASGTWTSATPLNVARISAQPALLPDGRVLVVAGSTTGAGGTSLSSSELYVPGH